MDRLARMGASLSEVMKHYQFVVPAVVVLFGCTSDNPVSPDPRQVSDPTSVLSRSRVADYQARQVKPTAASVQEGVPFRGICIGEVVLANGVIANVSGNGTLIGRFTGQLYEDMTVVLRAPDGSELHASITPKPTGDGGFGVVTGGTGRFENATGQWESTWKEATPSGWIETFVGRISSVGSNQE
jgi:hypothetical protein